MKPLIKWSGGKRNELRILKRFYPQENQYNLFIEPFCGGAAAFFDLEPKRAIISDIHSDLINFYKTIKNNGAKSIYDLMRQYENDEKIYYFIRDEYEAKTNIEKAFKFYYLRKTCYRGMLRYNSSGGFNVPFGRYKTFNCDELLDPKYTELLKRTIIFSKDFREIFKIYDSSKTFFWLDPPYDCVFKNYGFMDFDRKKHEDLANVVKNAKGFCLMVISATPFIRELYDGYIRHEYHKNYAFKIHSGRIGKEINKMHLVITNYDVNETTPVILRQTQLV